MLYNSRCITGVIQHRYANNVTQHKLHNLSHKPYNYNKHTIINISVPFIVQLISVNTFLISVKTLSSKTRLQKNKHTQNTLLNAI